MIPPAFNQDDILGFIGTLAGSRRIYSDINVQPDSIKKENNVISNAEFEIVIENTQRQLFVMSKVAKARDSEKHGLIDHQDIITEFSK